MAEDLDSSRVPASGRLVFDQFALRLDTLELSRGGRPLKLQRQPARLLALLALRCGEAVSREEIRRHLWGEHTFVEYEQALNFAVRQLRRTLGDSAAAPRFVETVPRFGYRFLARAYRSEDRGAMGTASGAGAGAIAVNTAALGAEAAGGSPHGRRPVSWRRRWAAAATVGALLAVAIAGWMSGRRGGPPEGPSSVAQLPRELSGRNGRALKLAPAAAERQGREVSPAGYEAYLEGLYLAHSARRPGDLAPAVAALERATRMAPDFAPAWSELALARLDFGRPAAQVAAGVEMAARRALRLDPRNAQSHRALGQVALFLRFDLERARGELERTLAADPGSADAHLAYAGYLAAVGRLDEAIAEAERARRLDPVGKAVKADLVWFHFLARHYDAAIEQGRLAARLDPTASPGRLYWLLSEVMKKDDDAALEQAQSYAGGEAAFLDVPPPPRFRRLHDFWTWQLAMLTARRSSARISPAALALDHLALGNRDRALALLEEACDEHFGWMLPFLPYDPRADPLRGDPRFTRIVRCAGHPEAA